jgi:hypothetical protein
LRSATAPPPITKQRRRVISRKMEVTMFVRLNLTLEDKIDKDRQINLARDGEDAIK